jgi:hypothetical protein
LFPVLSRAVTPGWRTVGSFLPRSIVEWANAWPPERQAVLWEESGIGDVEYKLLSLGAGVVMWGRVR